MRKLLHWEFIYGGHLLSLGASSIVLVVILLLNLKVEIIILVIPYLITQIVYTYNHINETNSDLESNPQRVEFLIKKRKRMVILFFLYLILLIIFNLLTNIPTNLLTTIIVGGGIAYTKYFKSFLSQYLIGFKNFYTSLFWSLLVFFIPFFYSTKISINYIYLFLFIFLRLMVNTVFFDIKDIPSDKKDGIKTFPVKWGKNKTLIFLVMLNLVSCLPLLVGVLENKLDVESLFLTLNLTYSLYYIIKSINISERELRNLSYVMVDAEYFLWIILLLVGKLIVPN